MNLIILKLARNDLHEIHNYLSEFGLNPQIKFKESFKSFCLRVIDTPYLYARYEPDPKYRKAVIEYNYLVFYVVDENNSKIKIYRVLHGKRDASAFLNTDKS